MTSSLDEPTLDVTISAESDGRFRLAAQGETQDQAMVAAMTGVLAILRHERVDDLQSSETTTAIPFRAEAADLPTLFAALITALKDEIDHTRFAVRALQYDGLLRTDTGYTGWGYALAVESDREQPSLPALRVDAVDVASELGQTTIEATLVRG